MAKQDKPTKTKSSELSTEDLDKVAGGGFVTPHLSDDAAMAVSEEKQPEAAEKQAEADEKPVSEKGDALEKPTEANKLTPDAEKPGSEKAWSVPGGVYEVD